jgi:glycosyltransferase involved in cell wall biosynthesis
MSVDSGDIFLGLDLNHRVPIVHQTALKYLHKNGIDVRFIIYDLLPIQFPDFFEKKHSIHSLKNEWLSFVTSLSGAICISKTVAEDLAVWIKNNPTASKRNFNINWFHLGADIDQSLPTKGFLQNEQLNLDNLRSTTTFLMVGTLEPRKGHAQVLDAFEKLWQDGADIKLIIVGKEGWLVNSLVTRLREHKELDKRLFWMKNVRDEFLTKIYATSACLIAASYGEGFGLPLIEAARHKLPIICRDIPVFREVAGQHAHYFIASNGGELAHSIQQWLNEYKIKKHPKSDHMPYLTWKQSADMLLNILK